MMIPITRKEKYINEIVGGGNTAPETPQTREELFFADILGEVVAPSPVTRAEKYLSAIAGKYNGELPEPITRIERFIARAAGMDIETPTPITREEIFWSNYSAIVDFEVEGVPPLTYKAIEGTLENYRIYGDTVDGESVGDKTGNLFDGVVEQGSFSSATGEDYPSPKLVRTGYIPVSGENDYVVTVPDNIFIRYIGFYGTQWSFHMYGNHSVEKFKTPTGCNKVRIVFQNTDFIDIVPNDIVWCMLNEGSTVLPYEPYGYKVPVTISNGTDTLTTPIYLPEPLKMVGNEAEYIDYAEQKQHRVRKNLLPNTATSQTINGVTFTVNSDKSVTCNGTASPTYAFLVIPAFLLPAGTYILVGCPNGGTENKTYKIILYVNNEWKGNDKGSGISFTLTESSTASVMIVVYNGYICNNLTFYPMIRKADIEDDTYEPYIENTDLDVTLPALPTVAGTNTLTVGTQVQPSKVYVKGEKRRD